MTESDLLPTRYTEADIIPDPPKEKEKESRADRWKRLENEYGRFRAFWPFWFGERKDKNRLTEHEPRLPWYAVSLIYVTSFAAGIVSGSADLIAMATGFFSKVWIEFVVAGLLFAALLLMVAGMDKSLARTIPRIDILRKRREWGLWWECMLYSAAVGAIEIATLTILILNENKISEILQGHPLISITSSGFIVLAVGRATMTFWTIVHSHLVNEPLPVQLSTAKREGAALFGGELMRRIRALENHKRIRMGKIMENFLLFLTVDPKAPRSGDDTVTTDKKGVKTIIPYNRLQRQAELTKEHHTELIKALDELEMMGNHVVISPVSNISNSPSGITGSLPSGAGAKRDEPGAPKTDIDHQNAAPQEKVSAQNGAENDHGSALSSTENTPFSDQRGSGIDEGGVLGDDSALSRIGASGEDNSHHVGREVTSVIGGLHALSKIWDQDKLIYALADLTPSREPDPQGLLYTRLSEREITSMFGAGRTFSRNYGDHPNDIPRFDDGKTGARWRLGDILWMEEQGWLTGSTWYSTYLVAEAIGNGHSNN